MVLVDRVSVGTVLVDDPRAGLVEVVPSLRDRARTRFLAARWDRQLAVGVPPEREVCLALRAQRLVEARTRHWLALSLQRLRTQPRGIARTATPMTPTCRRRLADSGDVLAHVIDRLERPAPLSSRGVAALCVLLRDGSGPLYGIGSPRELRERLGEVDRELLPFTIW